MKRDVTNQIVLCDSDSLPHEDLDLSALDDRDRRRGYMKCVYHFIIKRDGEIEHGHRKHGEPAMGLGHWNNDSVSICLVGGRGTPPFTRPQLASLKDLLEELQDEYPNAVVTYHHLINKKMADRGLDLVALSKDLLP